MAWAEIDLDDVELEGISREDFDATYGAHMRLFVPDNLPVGAVHYDLTGLRLDTSGMIVQHGFVKRSGGTPDPGCTIIEGWVDGPVLTDGAAPPPGQPPGYPNRGRYMTEKDPGTNEVGWGPGEGHAPEDTEGAHWYWISVPGCYSNVVCGFGWRWGTDHWHMEPIFTRVEPGDEPPPEDGDVAEAILTLAAQVGRVADALAGFPRLSR